MALRILAQLFEEKKFLQSLENPQLEAFTMGMISGDSLVDVPPQDLSLWDFFPEFLKLKDKIKQIFINSQKQNPGAPRITSLGGIHLIGSSPSDVEDDIVTTQLLFFPIELSIFEITSLIWKQIKEESKKRSFSKVVFLDRDEFVLQCLKNIVESQIQEIQQIIQQVGQEVLPFSGLTCEISQLEKLEN